MRIRRVCWTKKKRRWDDTAIMERSCDAGKPLCEKCNAYPLFLSKSQTRLYSNDNILTSKFFDGKPVANSKKATQTNRSGEEICGLDWANSAEGGRGERVAAWKPIQKNESFWMLINIWKMLHLRVTYLFFDLSTHIFRNRAPVSHPLASPLGGISSRSELRAEEDLRDGLVPELAVGAADPVDVSSETTERSNMLWPNVAVYVFTHWSLNSYLMRNPSTCSLENGRD